MNKNYIPTLIVIVLGIMIQSCEKENPPLQEKDQTVDTDNAKIIMGDTLEIPYTVANMQTAFDNLIFNLKKNSKTSKLAKTFKDGDDIEILPSHYYYRFLPKDSLEHDWLVNDTILQVSNIPLHLKVVEEGDYYDDPDLEGDENPEGLAYLYAVVPYDHPVPENIHKELLDTYYFAPEQSKEEPVEGEVAVKQPVNKTTKDILNVDENGEVFEYLELEALKLTNNLDEDELAVLRFYLPNDTTTTLYSYDQAAQLGYEQKQLILDLNSIDALLEQETLANRSKWNPSGTITVQEDVVKKTVGVVGAEVKVRKWGLVVIKRARTNHKGEFRTSSTSTKRVKYAVYFQNKDRKFQIKAGTNVVNAKHRGTKAYKKQQKWNQHFTYGRSKFYALVHNAAYDFYDRAVGKFGLHHPNQSWLRISAKYNSDAGNHLDLNPWGKFSLMPYSEIRLGRFDGRRVMASDEIYGLVVHEMTHASHYRMDRSFFINLRGLGCTLQTMAESWATGVETVVTNDRYLGLNANYRATIRYDDVNPTNLYNSRKQSEIILHGDKEEYTPIVIDLIDNYNQQSKIGLDRPVDRVHGYTLKQIQASLNNSRGPHAWKERIKSLHKNATEIYVDELFAVYMFDNC